MRAATGYLVYDVFTDRAFGGNPLAIVPDASGLDPATMADIAREFGYSETIYLLPPRAGGTRAARIFTPTQEIPFAGHPLIGAAVALADDGGPARMLIETGAGPVPCLARDGRGALVRSVRLERLGTPDPALVADCLGLSAVNLLTRHHAPVIASAGLPFCLVELHDPAALAGISPRIEAFRRAQAASPLPFDFAVYAYAYDRSMGGDRIRARMFAPLDNIPEDPATGSAAAALGLLLADLAQGPVEVTIDQGVEMGRPSVISVSAEAGSVAVSGHAVRVMEGRLFP
ncbi:PhzF family phenazine biosynthesis protein [Palleronia rufa]|uniref:PhzF family phenazine biosynthesis protein n=1 Tax=Palleronia rufa TaxID=1530186 RepID=UPI000564C0BC|nr:PhzF family phenazine biosynthesis protein [Palleronia rufa]